MQIDSQILHCLHDDDPHSRIRCREHIQGSRRWEDMTGIKLLNITNIYEIAPLSGNDHNVCMHVYLIDEDEPLIID